ncbi:hypothetical protein [Vibrio phage vB_VmeM-Yong XC32]|nr:hypothetical protein [Vibrio phage vB_VmeM-Yong XC31]QAX96441.1 hypothetical protein [Vibrio phage vB_VmeM-Yong XC32]QAX96758.1 hypothetical protein [Vibrio phage vB_VmeM-Yong MS31]QAX97077.1 hypothetical protein [Vibrio phage vB_VmeM-Yong MS32]
MDVSSLTHNPKAIHAAIHKDTENHMLIAKEDISLHIPEHYFNGKLGTIDGRYNAACFVGWIVGGSYALSRVHAIMPFTPEEVGVVKVKEGSYYVLSWTKGSVICPNYRLAQKKTLVFEVYDEIVAKGKQPWYIGHRARAELFYSAPKFAGVDLGGGQSLQSIFASSCIRDPADRSIPAREGFATQEDYDNAEVDIIPLRSVAFGADNTASRLLGSYLKTGIASSLVNPSETTEEIESLLRL